MKYFIRKRCQDYSDSPSSMINSLLEKKKRVINLDRIIIRDNNNNEILINDSEQVKTETIKHFQTIANSTHHPISNENENWKL